MALHVKHEEKGQKMTTKPKTVEELEKEIENLKKQSAQPFDPSKISDEDFAKIFADERIWKNDRFKELNSKAKKGEELKKLQEEAEQKKLLEEKKFQEVIDSQKKQIEELQGSVAQVKIDSAIRQEAIKAGVVDPDVVAKLIDRSGIKQSDDGSLVGVTEAIKGLTDSKPYLVGKPITTLGTGTNPAGGGNASPRFKLSQLQDAQFYQANEKEINEALKNNQVENDMPIGK